MEYKDMNAIDIVKLMLTDGVISQEVAGKYFPELKESGGERIWIINYLSNRILNSTIIAEKENLKNAIAWLEKQGEKDEEILILKDQIESLHAAIKALKETHKIELEKQDKQKPTELGKNRSKELSLSLQIQAYLNTASDELYAKGKPLYSEKRIEGIHRCMLMWQKLHNAYFYQKPAWSEEDEKRMNHIIQFLEDKDRWKDSERAFPIEEDIRWLKSRFSQSTWKPSNEQMKFLWKYAEQNNYDGRILSSLYDDLKKL